MNLIEIITELLVGAGIIKRTRPIMIAKKLAGLEKLQKELKKANKINAQLALEKENAKVKAAEQAEKEAEKEAADLKAKIEALEKESRTKQAALKSKQNAEAAAAEKFIATAKEEAEKADVISSNLVFIATKRLEKK
ncbi:hypothetical protein J4226_02135 [Candidatus Pacearchaeota archaeon]|nr:hypothetical protein [Candidatus Pacearchaeota archaeon]